MEEILQRSIDLVGVYFIHFFNLIIIRDSVVFATRFFFAFALNMSVVSHIFSLI